METILSAQHLAFRRGRQTILRDASLELRAREVVALIGGNGAGKTTLLEILTGALSPDRGTVRYHAKLPRFWLGYLPDKAPLYPQWRVCEFLQTCAQMRGVRDVKAAMDDVIARCHLQAVAHKRCGELSHGYRQRVGLAQALIHRPPLLVLDEPTNGLDSDQRAALRPLLAGLGESGCVLMTSHNWDEVLTVAQRVYRLHDGVLQEIVIPRVDTPHLWVAYDTVMQAQAFAAEAVAQDDRFLAFAHDGSAASRQSLWQRLVAQPGVSAFYDAYPDVAFQEKLSAAACQSEEVKDVA
ncbi:ABC transporter ATP-binding protein [uncultured Cardiobacterium sp.]|uniref:ABC transporter ATP-binding protein n=1 Tax=uncultured Cardiobacterium sp. TaxID=417619 RepID=UPI00262649F8|nr:ABC transporter ATP-binding protein [uncultured Cardiobacterium sp.]